MAGLLDLPNELLDDSISRIQPVHKGELMDITPKTDLLALSLTSKRLHSLTQAALYRDIQLLSCDAPKLRVLLRNIHAEPRLAAHIVRISFLKRSLPYIPLHDFPRSKDDVDLDRKFVTTVQRADIPGSTQWISALREGLQDAQMALLVLCAVNIQVLQVELHLNQKDFFMLMADHVISQPSVHDPKSDQTFHKLKHIIVIAASRFQTIGVSPLLLPSVREFRLEGAAKSHLSELAIDHIRQRSAPLALTSLTLPYRSFLADGILDMIKLCKVLEHFHVVNPHRHAFDAPAVNKALQLANPPLVRLSLSKGTSVHGIPIGSLRHLSVLRELQIDIEVLLGNPLTLTFLLPELLPASIFQLKLSLDTAQKDITDDLDVVDSHLKSLETSCIAGLFPRLDIVELDACSLSQADAHVIPRLEIWEDLYNGMLAFPQAGTLFILNCSH